MNSVPPRSEEAALAHVRQGGRLAVATSLRVYVIDKRTLARFEKAGAWLLKAEGEGYRMRDGRGSIYLFPGQLVFA